MTTEAPSFTPTQIEGLASMDIAVGRIKNMSPLYHTTGIINALENEGDEAFEGYYRATRLITYDEVSIPLIPGQLEIVGPGNINIEVDKEAVLAARLKLKFYGFPQTVKPVQQDILDDLDRILNNMNPQVIRQSRLR